MDFWSCAQYLLLGWAMAYALRIAICIRSNQRRLPPGPSPWPIVGNLFSLGDKPHKSLAELAKIYGPIMKLELGSVTTVVISSSSIAREVFHKHDLALSSRCIPDAVRVHDHDKLSVGWIPVSPTWRTLRKIMNSNVFTTQKLDSCLRLRHQKVQQLISDVQKSCQSGNSVDIGVAAFNTTFNLLSSTILSTDSADFKFSTAKECRELMWNVSEVVAKPNLVDCFPVLKVIDPQGIRRQATVHYGKIIELFRELIDKRLESRKVESYKAENDVLDNLIDIAEDSSNDIDRSHIEHLLLDLFAAGVDTTANTLEWAMAELLRNPKILSEAQAELKRIVGGGKAIEESDIIRLPYLNAIVKETFRLHPTVPLLLPRKADADVEINGFTVPKDARVLVNVYAIARDPNMWENPHVFMPERFLGSKIDVKGHDFELIPFGAGRRICPGNSLGLRMFFLMLGSLINSFEWKVEEGSIDMEDKFGLTLQKAQPLYAVPVPVYV